MFRSLCLVVVLSCSLVVSTKDVTILVIEELNGGRKGPPYDATVIVQGMEDSATLFSVMKEAERQGLFTFGYTLHPKWGAYITTINGLAADSTAKQYWQILGGARMKPTQFGASSYLPDHQEKVLFRLVTWDREP